MTELAEVNTSADITASLEANDLGNMDNQWQLRPAVVVSFDVSKMTATAIFDGDTSPVPMIALIGNIEPDARVFVLRVPPSGNYIIARPIVTQVGYAGPRTTNKTANSSTIQGVLRVSDINIFSGHVYRIRTTTLNMSPSASGLTAKATVHVATAGVADNTSPVIGFAELEAVATFVPRGSSVIETEYVATANTTLSVYMGWALAGGAGTVTLQGSSTSPIVLYVDDLGPRPQVSGEIL